MNSNPRSGGVALDGYERLILEELEALRSSGTHKAEIVLTGHQQPQVSTEAGSILNLCANNYLGLAAHPAVNEGARRALEERGVGMASVRFICGTQDEHRALERDIADFLGYEDALVQMSCWDANSGVFGALLGPDDVVLSDALNHASIIDGIRLSRAKGVVYRHADMDDLRTKLIEHREARIILIATDGVFSMEGDLAPLDSIVELADEFGCLVLVDDSHGIGVVGATGRGTAEHYALGSRIDIQTGTFGKALGGAAGGYTVSRAPVIEMLRQRSRTYLFSNSVPPPIIGAARSAIRLLREDTSLLASVRRNTSRFRAAMDREGFLILPGEHPVVAVMIGDETKAMRFAEAVREEGVLVVAFSFPVVPRGEARIRVQISAAHTDEEIDRAVAAFVAARVQLQAS